MPFWGGFGGVLGSHHIRPRSGHRFQQGGGGGELATPTIVRALRDFLGLIGYYRKFIKAYGEVATPLTKLLKKEDFAWSLDANATFHVLKATLISGPTLQLPNFSKPFLVDCDAFGIGFGAVLHQGT